MAIRTRDELLAQIKNILGDNTSDDAIGLVEDVTDTMQNYEQNSGEDWKAKYEANDKQWREKYRNRFYSTDPLPEDDKPPIEEEEKPLTYDSLFKEEK